MGDELKENAVNVNADADALTLVKEGVVEAEGRMSVKFKIALGALTIVLVVAVVMSFVLFTKGVTIGTKSATEAFESKYEQERKQSRDNYYNKAYDKNYEKYKVSNKVEISISSLSEISKLEVLKVGDTEYVILDKNDKGNDYGVTCWIEVPGYAVFTVNLEAAECLLDEERQYVLIRVPYPETEAIAPDVANISKLFYKEGDIWKNGSYSEGAELAQDLIQQGILLMQREIRKNEDFFLSAQKSAKRMIEGIVKNLNPLVENLVVEVEFY